MTTHSDQRAAAINRAIGARVAWYMRYAGDRRTQTELAQLLDLDQSGISKKLAGRRPFQPHELYAVAEWLDRPLSDLLPLAQELESAPALSPPRTRRRVSASAVRDTAVNRQVDPGDTREYVSSPVIVLTHRSRRPARFAQAA